MDDRSLGKRKRQDDNGDEGDKSKKSRSDSGVKLPFDPLRTNYRNAIEEHYKDSEVLSRVLKAQNEAGMSGEQARSTSEYRNARSAEEKSREAMGEARREIKEHWGRNAAKTARKGTGSEERYYDDSDSNSDSDQ